MKIGFSFGRCIRDIVNGVVDIDDVVVLVTGTRLRNKADVKFCIDAYLDRPQYLRGLDPEQCHRVAEELWDSGKVHQPRNFKQHRSQVNENYLWADLFPTEVNHDNVMVKSAWEEYRSLLALLVKKKSSTAVDEKGNWGSHQ